jgi:hypothetical protein
MGCNGYEIVCPDGQTRHYPYTNEGDALCDAESYDRRGCATWKNGERVLLTDCPGGIHTVRPTTFEDSVQ